MFLFSAEDDPNIDPSDRNSDWDLFVKNIGVEDLGVAMMAGTGSTPRPTGAMTADGDTPIDRELKAASILEARLVYRPSRDDMFIQLDVDRLLGAGRGALSTELGPGTTLLYGARFSVGSKGYEVRIASEGTPSFGLFKGDGRGWSEIARLKGGYGTVGEALVASIPLTSIGGPDWSAIKDVAAFSAIGSYREGATKILDSVTLERR